MGLISQREIPIEKNRARLVFFSFIYNKIMLTKNQTNFKTMFIFLLNIL